MTERMLQNYCKTHDLYGCWLCPVELDDGAANAPSAPRGITLRCWMHEDDQICPDCTS